MNPAASPVLPQAFFLPAETGDRLGDERFCLFHAARGPVPRGSVLYLHPFAEELNNSRRVVAQAARQLADAGFAVLQIDLLGCGDSAGDFDDARWADWLADARCAQRWLAEQTSGPMWLWGLRGGALLASALAAMEPPPPALPPYLLLWQAVPSGEQMLQQFLRLHSAAQWLGPEGERAEAPARQLAQGAAVTIAGYTLTPALATGLREAQLSPAPATHATRATHATNAPDTSAAAASTTGATATAPRRLVWLDVSTHDAPALGPASERQVARWQAAGWAVSAAAVTAPAFWQQVGTPEARALVTATLQAMAGESPR